MLESSFFLQLQVCPRSQCISSVAVRTDLFKRNPSSVLVTEFFGSVRNVELSKNTIKLPANVTRHVER